MPCSTNKSTNRAWTAASRRLGALSNSCDYGKARNTHDHSAMVVGDSFIALLNEPNTNGASGAHQWSAQALPSIGQRIYLGLHAGHCQQYRHAVETQTVRLLQDFDGLLPKVMPVHPGRQGLQKLGVLERDARANAFCAATTLPTRNNASPRNIIDPKRTGRISSK
jgi:hypothetical protein